MSQYINTKIHGLRLKFAERNDVSLILEFIKEFAVHEEMRDMVTATEESLIDELFDKKFAEVILAELYGKPVAFALFYHSYSTFLGAPGIYLEDLYVKPKYRSEGIGTAILAYIASLAIERGCKRLDWDCLDWNADSISFYKDLGATQMDEWTTYRVDGEGLINLSKGYRE